MKLEKPEPFTGILSKLQNFLFSITAVLRYLWCDKQYRDVQSGSDLADETKLSLSGGQFHKSHGLT